MSEREALVAAGWVQITHPLLTFAEQVGVDIHFSRSLILPTHMYFVRSPVRVVLSHMWNQSSAVSMVGGLIAKYADCLSLADQFVFMFRDNDTEFFEYVKQQCGFYKQKEK